MMEAFEYTVNSPFAFYAQFREQPEGPILIKLPVVGYVSKGDPKELCLQLLVLDTDRGVVIPLFDFMNQNHSEVRNLHFDILTIDPRERD